MYSSSLSSYIEIGRERWHALVLLRRYHWVLWLADFQPVMDVIQVKSVPGQTTEFRVPKLKEGHNYMFRVKAENVHGQSSALVTQDAVKAENPFSE